MIQKGKKKDIRRRILVSYSLSYIQETDNYPSKSDILKNFKYPKEYKIEVYEVENTITDFLIEKYFMNQSILSELNLKFLNAG